ncbi:hypothetical protein N657DRAFT_300151 [Parathielavia appendiculata]|uniref:Uncharacterized protein n=1 Tax=Parathielavia appendiculata TaxID=2587402 RepID=A0AAN6U4F5_9PEZI|nr:hypothetical protein N657DRAFT_300151 [Parathielavia appendiculata]
MSLNVVKAEVYSSHTASQNYPQTNKLSRTVDSPSDRPSEAIQALSKMHHPNPPIPQCFQPKSNLRLISLMLPLVSWSIAKDLIAVVIKKDRKKKDKTKEEETQTLHVA